MAVGFNFLEPDFSLPILIATGKFLDSEAFGQDWQDLLAKQMYPYAAKARKACFWLWI
jgi:hypothetical protein